jgi:hypothetical protein
MDAPAFFVLCDVGPAESREVRPGIGRFGPWHIGHYEPIRHFLLEVPQDSSLHSGHRDRKAFMDSPELHNVAAIALRAVDHDLVGHFF